MSVCDAALCKPSVHQHKVRVKQDCPVQDQTNANPYTDLQVLTKKGPRGRMMFHLLTVFPNSAAEQERYYITKVLKKPQQLSICQFVQSVEQLNSYILQLPGWYYSREAKHDSYEHALCRG